MVHKTTLEETSLKAEDNDLFNLIKDRHILIAVDASDSSERAVLYVADFIGGSSGFRATIVNFIALPEEEFFPSEEEKAEWTEQRRVEANRFLEKYRQILLQSGFPEEKVSIKAEVKDCPSIAECIMNEQRKLGACTIVVARRKLSRQQEFLLGSTSSKLLRMPKNCSVWVIE